MNRREFLKTAGVGLAVVSGAAAYAEAPSGRLPNVVLIFTDDQGYADLGVFGASKIRTPNVDRMAVEGMRFTDFYSAAPVCTPSRAALLTGCYPERVGKMGVLFPRSLIGLAPEETTIARMLKNRGYATACIGKWHLGHHPEFLPTRHGFDSYYGIPYSNDMTIAEGMTISEEAVLREGVTPESLWEAKKGWVPLCRGEEVIEYPADQALLTRRYTEEALRFIRENRSRPFFLYLPHTMPHIPLYASPEFAGRSEAGLYGDCIEEIDWSTGRILDALRELGLDRDTWVIYTSDNGPWGLKDSEANKTKGNTNRRVGGSAAPLRGFKFSRYEGGVREPTVMWWPGRIPAGSVCGEPVGTIDILPTVADVAGAALPALPIDGRSILPLIEGRPGAQTPHEALFYGMEGVRTGRWKLHKGELYDLESDLSETRDVAAENPAVVARLNGLLAAHRADMTANHRPAGRVAPAPAGPGVLAALPGWESAGGTWRVRDGVLLQTDDSCEAALFGPAAGWTDYDLEVTVRSTSGKEGCRVMVRVADRADYLRWSVGAFGNKRHSLMRVEKGSVTRRSKAHEGGIILGTPFRLRVEARGERVRCFLNGEPVNEEVFPGRLTGGIGLGSLHTAAEFSRLRVATPEGKVLWEALGGQ